MRPTINRTLNTNFGHAHPPRYERRHIDGSTTAASQAHGNAGNPLSLPLSLRHRRALKFKPRVPRCLDQYAGSRSGEPAGDSAVTQRFSKLTAYPKTAGWKRLWFAITYSRTCIGFCPVICSTMSFVPANSLA
ncbi:hypothetical protein AWB67_05312 [Caballeronia terrestris]|uniref:Uncharacterized protein n=1 Tax=Caballeronia terrestris TaxID=1226301 RepID=A0A158KCA0_9BURK|nr:hypothetical protein AWB67_05312 [Caballeronia terrestris]